MNKFEELSDKDKKRYSKREQFFARMGSFVAIGLAQALIVTLGNYFGLGVDVRDPFYSKAKYTLDVNLMDNYEKIKIFVTKLRELLGL